MESTSNEKMFRCSMKETQINLSGIIADNTDFHLLDEFVEKSCELNLTSIERASWIGLINFCKYLKDKNKAFIFCEIPFKLFRHIRLLTKYIQNFDVRNLYIDIYLLENLIRKDSDRLISDKEILALKLQGPCLTDDSRKLFIPEPIEYLNFESCKKGVRVDFHPDLKWTKEEFDELIFWYKLQKFTAETIDLMHDMHRTQIFQIFTSLQKIKRVIDAVEQVFDVKNQVKAKEFADYEAWFESEMEAISTVLDKVFIKSDLASRFIFHHLFFDKQKISDSIYLKLHDSSSEIVESVSISAAVEDIGSQGTKKFIEMDLCKHFHTLLNQACEDNQLDSKIEKIKESFKISDSQIAEKDFDLKIYLSKDIDSIDEIMIEEIVTYFQGFDLLNQVIHHRFNEAELVIDGIDRIQQGKTNTKEFQASILEKMQGSLATDQENSAFNFYFPNEANC